MEPLAARLVRDPGDEGRQRLGHVAVIAAKVSSVTSTPPNFSASDTTPSRSDSQACTRLARRGALVDAEPDDLRRSAADVEHDDRWASRSASSPTPAAARCASVSRSTISRSMPSRSRTAATKFGPLAAERQASVAMVRARVTPRAAILSRQIRSASSVRAIAASLRRPVSDRPSPSRTMREKASMTRKPSAVGRATRSRQLLVPRSSAA